MNQSQSLLLERVKSENARSQQLQHEADHPVLSSPECHSDRQTGLTAAQREAAIELAEILEMDFQFQGRFIEAEFASRLRQQLIAGREPEKAIAMPLYSTVRRA